MIEAAIPIIERRLALRGFNYAKASVVGRDKLKVRIPGADPDNIKTAARVMLMGERLEVFEIADEALQEAFNRSHTVSAGYKPIRNVAPDKRQDLPESALRNTDMLLLKETPILNGPAITDAWYERSSAGTWDVSFVLEDKAAQVLSEVGARLLKQRPSGRIAVVMSEELRYVWKLTSTSIGKKEKITGLATEDEARDLALILLSGSLLADLGSDLKGTPIRRDADSFAYYGMRGPEVPQPQKPK